MVVVRCRNLSKWYGGDVIGLNDLTVEIQEGITGLLGPNGAGKSTFMRLAMGLLRPSTGTITVLSADPWDNTDLRHRVGYVPEGPPPWPDLPGHDACTLAAKLSGLEDEDAEAAAERALGIVGLTDAAHRPVGQYSRGMGQKLKLALALLHEPELLVLDEPLQGTDPLARRDLIGLIKELAEEGRSIVVSTHILPDVEAMTQRILLLNHGRLMAHGDVTEIPGMLGDYPRTIRIGSEAPREISAHLTRWENVLGLETDEHGLVVRVRDAPGFHGDLQALLLDEPDLRFTSITAMDESVEAIFRELVD